MRYAIGDTVTTKAGDITILEKHSIKWAHTRSKCLCYCGKTFITELYRLKNGGVASCGCYKTKIMSEKHYKHGHSGWNRKLNIAKKTKTYICWASMKTTCFNKKHVSYKTCGEKGITLCDEWAEFTNFLKDMGEKPFNSRLCRIDKDGDFEPDNCEWVPIKGTGKVKRK